MFALNRKEIVLEMSIVSTVLFRLFLVGVVACLAPLLIYITRAYILPAVVLEIVGGIIIGCHRESCVKER
jgi:hypothetical protein